MQKVLKGRRTKRKLALALKEQLERRPLEKVRVHSLTEPCDLHRQTFYYHFEDVYALFAWCVAEDAEAAAAEMAAASTWQEALGVLLELLARDRGYSLCLLDHTPLWEAFCAKVLPAAAEKRGGDNGFSLLLTPLLEKWLRDGQPPEALLELLESLPLQFT